jgi:hypothetical protein
MYRLVHSVKKDTLTTKLVDTLGWVVLYLLGVKPSPGGQDGFGAIRTQRLCNR